MDELPDVTHSVDDIGVCVQMDKRWDARGAGKG